jgi:YcxB-like protein
MQLEAKTTYSRELISEAALIYWRKTFASTFFISLTGVVLALVLLFFLDSKTWITGTFLAISVIACVIFALAFFIYRARSLAVFAQMKSPTAKWRFSEDAFFVESDVGKSEIKWSLVKCLIKSTRAWLLVYKNSTYSVFPLAGVSSEVLAFMSQMVAENGGNVT